MVEALKEPGNENEREKAAASLLETLLALLDKLADDDVRFYSDALAALKELALEGILGVLSNGFKRMTGPPVWSPQQDSGF